MLSIVREMAQITLSSWAENKFAALTNVIAVIQENVVNEKEGLGRETNKGVHRGLEREQFVLFHFSLTSWFSPSIPDYSPICKSGDLALQ